MELFIGKKFKFIEGNSKFDAEIIDIQDIFVIVLINGKKFKLDKKILINKFAEAKQEKEQIKKKRITEEERKIKRAKHCRDCMEYKNGNCFGAKQICEDFRNSPKTSDEERSRWPKNGQVSRIKSDKYFIREYDWMYDNYNHYH